MIRPASDNGRVIDVEPARFEDMVAAALDGLPEGLGRLMQNVAVTVEHGPGPPGLLGLYQGIPLTSRTSQHAGGVARPHHHLPRGDLRGLPHRTGDRLAAGLLAPHARVGAAIHSVRAVAPDQIPEIIAWSRPRAAPVHAHLSEQPR